MNHQQPNPLFVATVEDDCAVLSRIVRHSPVRASLHAAGTETNPFEVFPIRSDAGALDVVAAIEAKRAQGFASAPFFATFAEGKRVVVLASRAGDPDIVRCAERGPDGRLGDWRALGADWLTDLNRSGAHA